ncbi:MAG: hypothetical protein QM724_05985 [Flavobacteriales bacterium]
MSLQLSFPRILAGGCAVLVLCLSCASGPRYGAARSKHRKECDCPKWNAVPAPATKDVRAMDGGIGPTDRVTADTHGSGN